MPSRTLTCFFRAGTREPGESHVCPRSCPARGDRAGSWRSHRGSALLGKEVGGCRQSTGAAAGLRSTLQSLQSEKGSTGVILSRLPLSQRSPRRRKLSPRGSCSAGDLRTYRSRRKRAQLCPATNPQKLAVLVRLLWDEPVACPGADVTSPDAGTASAVSPTTQRGDNCSSAAASQPSREFLRLHSQRLKINSVATRDKEKSVQGDTFPAPRSKRGILCLCQRLPPAASRSHLPLLNASAVPAAAQSSPARCQGMPSPFWNTFTEKIAIALTKVLAVRWLEQVWLCSAGHHIVTTHDRSAAPEMSSNGPR